MWSSSVALKQDAALYVDPPGMTKEETQHAALLRLSIQQDIDALKLDTAGDEIDQLAEVIGHAQMRQDLGLDRVAQMLRDDIKVELPKGATPKETKEIETLQATALAQLDPPLSAEKIEKSRELAKPVFSAVEAIERRLEVADADPAVLYERLKLRKNDVLNYPADYRSPAVAKLCNAVAAADMDVQLQMVTLGRAAQGKPREDAAKTAVASVNTLRAKIDAALPALRAHDTEVRKYFATLKKMTPQIKVADTLPEIDAGTDTAWKAERQAYDVARLDVVKLQNEKKFREANVALTNCATLMKALLDKRRTAIDGDIAGAGNDAATRNVVSNLDAKGLLAILTPQQQLDIIRKLPRGPPTDPRA